MKGDSEIHKSDSIEKVKHFLVDLGFVCKSYPSAQNLIYQKKDDVILIKNRNIKEH